MKIQDLAPNHRDLIDAIATQLVMLGVNEIASYLDRENVTAWVGTDGGLYTARLVSEGRHGGSVDGSVISWRDVKGLTMQLFSFREQGPETVSLLMSRPAVDLKSNTSGDDSIQALVEFGRACLAQVASR